MNESSIMIDEKFAEITPAELMGKLIQISQIVESIPPTNSNIQNDADIQAHLWIIESELRKAKGLLRERVDTSPK